MSLTYINEEAFKAANPGRWLAIGNRIIQSGVPLNDGHARMVLPIAGQLVAQNFDEYSADWNPADHGPAAGAGPAAASSSAGATKETHMVDVRANVVAAGGNLRATGAKLFAAYTALKAIAPDVTEAEWAAAEAAAGGLGATSSASATVAPAAPAKPSHLASSPYPVQVVDDDDPNMAPTVAGQANMRGWPRAVHVDQGANVLVSAPLNRKWKASGNWFVFGVGGAFLTYGRPGQRDWNDVSNGNLGTPPQPLRSPSGYPLTYTFDANGAVIGTPTLDYDGHGFNNEAELAAYQAAQPAPTTTPDPAWQDAFDRMKQQKGQAFTSGGSSSTVSVGAASRPPQMAHSEPATKSSDPNVDA